MADKVRDFIRRVRRWRNDRCEHCGHRFRWRKDARHSFGNDDRRVYHDPCIGYVMWRTAAEERLEILGIVCQVWGVSDRDIKGGGRDAHPGQRRGREAPRSRIPGVQRPVRDALGGLMSLDPALCADGCGRPADRERQMSDGHIELVCEPHATQEDG